METQAQIVSPDSESQAEQEISNAMTVYVKAFGLVVITPDDYKYAGTVLGEIKAKLKILEETEESMIKPLRDGYNNSRSKILLFFSPTKEKLEKMKKILSENMLDWVEKQKAKEREEEKRLQEIARKRAEEEALAQALEAEAAGETQEAEAIIQQPVEVMPIKVMSEIPKSKESHIRETWSAELVSLKDLVYAIAVGEAPLMAVKADMVFLNEQARSYKQALKIPGVKAISKKTQI